MPNPWQKSSAKTRTRTALSQMSPIKTQSAALQILGELGGLEILINNASDLGAVPLALLADTNCEDLEKAVATNVLGPFRLTKDLLARGVVSGGSRGSSSPGGQYLHRYGTDALFQKGGSPGPADPPPPPLP